MRVTPGTRGDCAWRAQCKVNRSPPLGVCTNDPTVQGAPRDPHPPPLTLLLACSALAVGAQTAAADVRISIGGGGHIRIGGGGHARAHWVRHHHRVHVGGAIWIGGVYRQLPAQPPPPPPPPQPACNCEPNYYPIAPQPVAYAAVAPAPRAAAAVALRPGRVPRQGVAVDGEHEGKDAGLVAQLRVGKRFQLEAELAKNELADGAREDRRFMAGLQFEPTRTAA